MRKNIAIFCDGTWQSLSQRYPTNVTNLARCVAPETQAGALTTVAQVVFYDDGVGVGEGVLDPIVRLVGGGLGVGLDRKIARCYEYLCLNYEPGDHVFIFGFSRGAYTARSLSGLLRKCWILRKSEISRVDEAMTRYRSGELDDPEAVAFKAQYCYPTEPFLQARAVDPKQAAAAIDSLTAHVQYVGVWDTVGALGIPPTLPYAPYVNRRYRFHDLKLSRFVVSARHAVSIDERRKSFAPTLWDNIKDLNDNAGAAGAPHDARPYQQSWFPGRHSGVGGGENDGGLCISAMLWIADGAARAGLGFDQAAIQSFAGKANPRAPFVAEDMSLTSRLIRLTGMADRDGPGDPDDISDAARQRWRNMFPPYRPAPLAHFSNL